ncbi:uncharacterized protein LOC123527968 [Mercenaria mercenaria]|uniref:uncharacterized protein LOC123527968 n=1 Tax=Mercenaria mercenaria TaxID=6596 RepID=UPI00234FB35C|nr:uncharacterized protein LOC123527968 [Mercenaria mercenaria]
MATNFSTLLNSAMDCIGYSKTMIVSRKELCNKYVSNYSQTCSGHLGGEVMLAGSKSEGVLPFYASDFDYMTVLNTCVCVDVGCQEDGLVVIETYNKGCPPGYTKLKLLNTENTLTAVILHMCSVYDISKGVVLLKSTDLQHIRALDYVAMPSYQGLGRKCLSVTGPAISLTIQPEVVKGMKTSNIYVDQVLAIRLYSSSVLQEWKERKRVFEWPSPDNIQDISTMEGYVVPVGPKYSEEQNFEWRICYTTAERKLVSSLSEVQLKLYILFKMVNREMIKPKVDCVSSYIIKNIIFWTVECSPADIFTPSNLIHTLLQCLRFLLHCLHNNYLPNYMIPSRNLLLGKIESEQKPKLKNRLRDILNEGEKCVLKCNKLGNAMFIIDSNRSLASRFRVWRDEVEELYLIFTLKMISKMQPSMLCQSTVFYDLLFEFWKDESFMNIITKLMNLLSIDGRSLLGNFFQNFEEIDTWMKQLFS